MNNNFPDIFIEAMIRWRTQCDYGDEKGKDYFNGGIDSIVMLAQMLGFNDKWIQDNLTK